jgi:hypothetical protein
MPTLRIFTEAYDKEREFLGRPLTKAETNKLIKDLDKMHSINRVMNKQMGEERKKNARP